MLLLVGTSSISPLQYRPALVSFWTMLVYVWVYMESLSHFASQMMTVTELVWRIKLFCSGSESKESCKYIFVHTIVCYRISEWTVHLNELTLVRDTHKRMTKWINECMNENPCVSQSMLLTDRPLEVPHMSIPSSHDQSRNISDLITVLIWCQYSGLYTN